MIKKIVLISFLLTIITCQPSYDSFSGHRLTNIGDILMIEYKGKGEVVQFKMFEGIQLLLKKNRAGIFEGQIAINDLDESIFSYEIIVHEKDSAGNMIQVDYRPKEKGENHFIWVGNERNIYFPQASILEGLLQEVLLESAYLNESRVLTIYTPKNQHAKTPIIYLTDGATVAYYAPYVDTLISLGRIKPIKLVGVHASAKKRYQEYVDNGIDVDAFKNHEDFFFDEVLNEVESKVENWNGDRYLFGFSNGAAFCIYSGVNHPGLFTEVVAFSTADYISELAKPIDFKFKFYPKFYLAAGRYEESIINNNLKFISKLKSKNIDIEFKEFISGHDYNVWRIEFLLYVEAKFKK